ncbi:hypothetical protein C8R43DRAFT_946420 [Mycena crocata]|nr:hypothetical protein C8R43DRAFT_946420 [Mycena crocata]
MPPTFTTIAAASKPHVRFTEPKPRAPLGTEERKEANQKRSDKQDTIDAALAKWYNETYALAEDLSVRYKRQPKYYLEMMFQGGAHMIHQQVKPNAYNAFKAIKAAECRERGESKNAPQIHRDYGAEYDALDDEQKADYVKQYQEDNGEREIKLRRNTPRSKLQDVNYVVKNMKQLFLGLRARVGVEGFFCVVGDSADFNMIPQWFWTSQQLEDYMPLAVGKRWVTNTVGTKLEAFAVAGCDVLGLLRTSRQKADFLKARIRDFIAQKIIAITKDENATMQYVWYEEDVVQRYSIKLVGWTYPELVNPSELSTSLPGLQALHDALKNDTCKFVKLNKEQLAARKESWLADVAAGRIERKHRDERSDKGTKRKRTEDDEEEADDGARDADGDGARDGAGEQQDRSKESSRPKSKKRRTTAKLPPPPEGEDPTSADDAEPREALPPAARKLSKKPSKGTAATAKTKAAPKKAATKDAPGRRKKSTTTSDNRDGTTSTPHPRPRPRALPRRVVSKATISSDDEEDVAASGDENVQPNPGLRRRANRRVISSPDVDESQSPTGSSAPAPKRRAGDVHDSSHEADKEPPHKRPALTSDEELENDPDANNDEDVADTADASAAKPAASRSAPVDSDDEMANDPDADDDE